MALRRHSTNPAKLKADADKLRDSRTPSIALQAPGHSRRWLFAGLLSVPLMTLSFAPFDQWYLAFVALVPWTLAVTAPRPGRGPVLMAWAAGALYWAASVYWLALVTVLGYGAAVVYLSFYWLAAGWLIRRLAARCVPLTLALPVIWVALEYARNYVISGFPWFYMAHSQYNMPVLIQISDATGQYGVSFVVLSVAGLAADCLRRVFFAKEAPASWRSLRRPALAVAVLLVATIGYGVFRLGQQTTSPGPRIALVQQAYPIALDEPPLAYHQVAGSFIDATKRLKGEELDLVVWPETMLPKVNCEMQELTPSRMCQADFDAIVPRLACPEDRVKDGDAAIIETYVKYYQLQAQGVGMVSTLLRCPVLAGAGTLHPNPQPAYPADRWVARNSALLFDRSPRPVMCYSKMHLVPFSEYVPFKKSWLGLHNLLREFVPSVMEQLDPGPEIRHFRTSRNGADWTFVTPICYEGVFAELCRDMVRTAPDGKGRLVIANVSNDGWFVYKWDGKWQGSTEHMQHLSAYVFRAVENRVPVVRAVNTGISGSIDSNGRIVATISKQGEQRMIAGTLVLGDGAPLGLGIQRGPGVLVDSRVSLYSLVGDAFAALVSVAAALLAAWGLLPARWIARVRPGKEAVPAGGQGQTPESARNA